MLHEAEFDTVLGRIGFDEKGDVEGFEPFVWYRVARREVRAARWLRPVRGGQKGRDRRSAAGPRAALGSGRREA